MPASQLWNGGSIDHSGVLLVSMPWEALHHPPIQLGLLQAVLERAGLPTAVRSFNLDFMDHCVRATADRPAEELLGVAEYDLVVVWSRKFNLGDWIFSVPPFREPAPASERDYLELVREEPMSEPTIAAALRFRAQVPAFLDRCVAEVLAAAPRVVGFTTGANQTVASLILARLLKSRIPSLKVVFGGANCQGPMGEALHRTFPWVDVIVRGEGEDVLPPLVVDLMAGATPRPAPGLCYRDGDRSVPVPEAAGKVCLDTLPTPRYDEYFARLATTGFGADLEDRIELLYESARGCWWGAKSHCVFCGISDLVMPYRSKRADRVVEELAGLVERYGRRRFLIVDYIIDWRYFRDVLPRLRDLGQDLRLFCETKANLRKEQVQLFRDAGFEAVQAGVESLSSPILGLMKKGVTAFQNIRLLKWCAEFDVRLYWNVIYGLPGEPPDEYVRMADVVRSLVHLEPPQIVPLALDRFSPHHEDPEAFGLVVLGPRRDYPHIYPVADPATLYDIAYTFEFRHADGRDPETYAKPLLRAIDEWRNNREIGFGSLRWRPEDGGLVVTDRRPGLPPTEYRLDPPEAAIYQACADGATLDELWGAAREMETTRGREEVGDYLDELAEARLVYREGERYLALALPPDSKPPGEMASRERSRVKLSRECQATV
ncbi:MAG TPA: RiPP maturation radical SAM C-methyltransferase [Candidatus Polarisedimenticolia bacterium]|nr:RiPP maturation radical SAM C-methyltransferase [Candidatus Polarisedimenticolia bacterium]